ncbi:uncharacterized protein METZ01_LOCUS186241, partial [marine metagenome]
QAFRWSQPVADGKCGGNNEQAQGWSQKSVGEEEI